MSEDATKTPGPRKVVRIAVAIDGKQVATIPLDPDRAMAIVRHGDQVRFLGNAIPIDSGPLDLEGPGIVL